MEQFNLEKYLENPSRKVVTRRGNPVRIICTDRKHGEDELPIVFLEECLNGEFLLTCRNDGRCDNYDTQYDLFFADEEELTEFEKELINIVFRYKYWDSNKDKVKQGIKKDSKLLLDLARKELEPELDKKLKEVYNQGGLDTQEEITKCLPKWKKAKKDEELDCHVAIQQDDRVVLSDFVQKDEYYITLDVLNRLPKEE